VSAPRADCLRSSGAWRDESFGPGLLLFRAQPQSPRSAILSFHWSCACSAPKFSLYYSIFAGLVPLCETSYLELTFPAEIAAVQSTQSSATSSIVLVPLCEIFRPLFTTEQVITTIIGWSTYQQQHQRSVTCIYQRMQMQSGNENRIAWTNRALLVAHLH
jgi:hypothetical protein